MKILLQIEWVDNVSITCHGDVDNAKKIIQLLNGEEGPYRDIVLLNSAAALYVDDKVKNIKDGMELSRYSIDKGLAKSALEKLKEISNS